MKNNKIAYVPLAVDFITDAHINILKEVSNTLSIGYVSYPSLYKYYNEKILNNIRFVFNTNNHYLIPLTNSFEIKSLNSKFLLIGTMNNTSEREEEVMVDNGYLHCM